MTSTASNNWSLQPAGPDHLDAVCRVIDAYSSKTLGIGNDARRALKLTWGQPGFNVEADTRVAVSPDGSVAGYAEVEDMEPPHVQVRGWMRVHPEFQGMGAEAALLDWIELRAHQAISEAPSDARVTLSQTIPTQDEAFHALLQGRGYAMVRRFLRMAIELDHEVPEPRWTDGVSVRTLVFDDDLEEMVHAFRDSFRDHWGHVETTFEEDLRQWDHWIRSDSEFDSTLTFLAVCGDRIVGISSCDPRHGEDPDMGYVAVLGVRRAWRRRGVALALLHHTFREFQKRGRHRVCLGVDATSLTGAHHLYEAAGMKPVRQMDSFEKELRVGIDLSRQSLDDADDVSS